MVLKNVLIEVIIENFGNNQTNWLMNAIECAFGTSKKNVTKSLRLFSNTRDFD